MRPDTLYVTTHKSWIADEFKACGSVNVKHLLGYSAPLVEESKVVAWWMPTETAARYLRAGVLLNLNSPDSAWLSRVPTSLTGRQIITCTLREAADRRYNQMAWCKLANVKISTVPATRIEVDYFVANLKQLGVPEDTVIQICEVDLAIKYEFRCFVKARTVTTCATYINADTSFGQDDFLRNLQGEERAAIFAQEVVDIMGLDQASSYTLDIAELASGRLVVLEANPVWSSNPYDCDKSLVLEAVIDGTATLGDIKTHGLFQWEMDPYLHFYANRMSKLVLDASY